MTTNKIHILTNEIVKYCKNLKFKLYLNDDPFKPINGLFKINSNYNNTDIYLTSGKKIFSYKRLRSEKKFYCIQVADNRFYSTIEKFEKIIKKIKNKNWELNTPIKHQILKNIETKSVDDFLLKKLLNQDNYLDRYVNRFVNKNRDVAKTYYDKALKKVEFNDIVINKFYTKFIYKGFYNDDNEYIYKITSFSKDIDTDNHNDKYDFITEYYPINFTYILKVKIK